MTFSADQALALAPDAASAAAGRKLASPRTWQHLGRSDAALWGECQGSALYQVRADLQDLATRCSCPSRKFPCKHGLGLLLLAAGSPDAVPRAEPPVWVVEWLAKRAGPAHAHQTSQTPSPRGADTTQQARRAEKRLTLVRQGVEGLDLWLADLIRNGIAGLELQSAAFWEKQAARLVDAQAPGLAARVRRLASIPNASPNWPERLLEALGRLALLSEAFGSLDALDPALQADVRSLIGWTLKEDEVVAHGDLLRDTWLVLGRWIEDEDRGRAQRTWLVGKRSGRGALVLQFSFAGAPFPPAPVPGTGIEATLAFWPGAYPQRALVRERHGAPIPLTSFEDTAPPADDAGLVATPISGIDAFLTRVAGALARQPWLERLPCLLHGVVPAPCGDRPWRICDGAGRALPLIGGEHWQLLALSGGHPVDLAGEWDGLALRPLGVIAAHAYHPLGEAR